MDDLPEPGTRDDLLADAEAASWETNERMLQEWNRLGLLAAATKRPLGRGKGQAPALYTSRQRALFGLLAQKKQSGAKNEQLAKLVVYLWLNDDDSWVDSEQALAAVRTAIGRNPRKSDRVAQQAATALVHSTSPAGASLVARRKLIDEVAAQLRRGNVGAERLRPLVSDLMDRGAVTVIRGPSGAPLSTDNLVHLLANRAAAAARIASVTIPEMVRVRAEYQITSAQYQVDRPRLRAKASPEMAALFDEPTALDLVEDAAPITLYLLSVLRRAEGSDQ